MIASVREQYNKEFTQEKYEAYKAELDTMKPGAIEFRIAETPVFVPKQFTHQMIDACEKIVDVICQPNFNQITERAVPLNLKVPGESGHSHFIAFDFGVCENENGELEPQLIEMQGFPTLFAFQIFQPEAIKHHFNIPENFNCYLGDFNKESYTQLLKEVIIGDGKPEETILLEINPHQQKTRIDFYCTEYYTGIRVVDLMDLIAEGKELYYMRDGIKTRIRRIYNRIIFDDLQQQSAEVQHKGELLLQDLDVKWIPHPDWFFRISKFTLPFIDHPYVPKTQFLSELSETPKDLENYVLKPLFSFAGQGVVIDLTQDDMNRVKDPENWILQRKVQYSDVIKTPDGAAKAEIRIFYFWKDGEARPIPTNNLARMSKGKMIGVRYNKDKEWVGGTACFFEK